MNKLIDIIIPCYNNHDTLVQTLASILNQTLIDKCKITIVNDNGNDYNEIVNYYSKYMDIQEITRDSNGGPGVSRQFGIDNTDCPFLMFVDADDSFSIPLAIEMFYNKIAYNLKINLVIGRFFKEQANRSIVEPPLNIIFLFSKIYRRSFIEKFDIRFSDIRANEDVAFNTIYWLCLENEEIDYIDMPLYFWTFNKKSITRKDDYDFYYNDSLLGYVDNSIYIVEKAKELKLKKDKIDIKTIDIITHLYFIYNDLLNSPQAEKYRDKNTYAVIKYYNEVFKDCKNNMDEDLLKEQIIYHLDVKLDKFKKIIPHYTFVQFLKALEGAQYDSTKTY